MIESHINGGRQDVPPEGPSELKYGVSITDACVEWGRTVEMLDMLNGAVQKRREVLVRRGIIMKGLLDREKEELANGTPPEQRQPQEVSA